MQISVASGANQPASVTNHQFASVTNQFTSVCPKTGQPDFANITIRYVPNEKCVELKSLKLYLWSFRNEGHFHEAVTNQILDDLVDTLAPRKMAITGDFNIRGGIKTIVEASFDGSSEV